MTGLDDVRGRVLPLLPDTHPALRRALPDTDLPLTDPAAARDVAAALEISMHAAEGIGLAANQVGLDVRAFAMETRDGRTMTLFNPRIDEVGQEPVRRSEEGCLSFPGLLLEVERRPDVIVSWTDAGGLRHQERMRGLDAVCAQHEIDHLDGIVFTSRVSRLVLDHARRRLAKERRRQAGSGSGLAAR